ncbi:MAG: S1 RNA-binding domain-containing protein, partial [Planctomycetia bacterium]|nr:S1 RNA-binding domain-containing protein [Planctomycetia bacterium]
VQLPSLRDELDDELQAEFDAMMGGTGADASDPVEEIMKADEKRAKDAGVEVGAKSQGRVISLRKDCMFVELGGYEQGVLMYRTMPGVASGEIPLPKEGDLIEVCVNRYNQEEGLYELTLPNAASKVEDWSDLSEGIIVEAKITGANKGGLECEVNHIRGFIPMGQVSLYRIEHPEDFIGEKWNCLITECNPMRRNLVLSRKSVLEREREAAKKEFLASLSVGQIYDGVVRRLMNFGAFVELGSGVDGLLPISQLSWARINHPSEVLSEGQPIRVRVERYDESTGKISLSYKDLLENPWTKAENVWVVGTEHDGTVTKIMDFGAFVQLEPGVEGLVHISEISYSRVGRVADLLSEGETVRVRVTSFDRENRRIGLSMKACLAPPQSAPTDGGDGNEGGGNGMTETAQTGGEKTTPDAAESVRPFRGKLRGGTGRSGSDGEKFGLKW